MNRDQYLACFCNRTEDALENKLICMLIINSDNLHLHEDISYRGEDSFQSERCILCLLNMSVV